MQHLYRNYIRQKDGYEPQQPFMRRKISLVLAALLVFASIALMALALSRHSYRELAAAGFLLIISLAWWWENRRA